MAKANVGKFYEKLAQDAALAEKLNALDKDFAEKNGASSDDAAMREKAVAAIVIPLAEEVGLPFTLEELKEYEQDRLKEMNLSEDE
ncbi:MAG: Nif11 family protein, partial [Schwartzia sp.]|nr:Nif11 family protein [Schwartzia sp. (in: firmicutes)]